jgi:hypothetical protein
MGGRDQIVVGCSGQPPLGRSGVFGGYHCWLPASRPPAAAPPSLALAGSDGPPYARWDDPYSDPHFTTSSSTTQGRDRERGEEAASLTAPRLLILLPCCFLRVLLAAVQRYPSASAAGRSIDSARSKTRGFGRPAWCSNSRQRSGARGGGLGSSSHDGGDKKRGPPQLQQVTQHQGEP